MDIQQLALQTTAQTYPLAEQYMNPNWVGVLRIVGLDKHYVRAEGSYLYDEQGQGYLDLHTGEGVASLGHNHPVVKQALIDAMTANLSDGIQIHYSPLAGLLAKALVERLPEPLDSVFFTNSGAETVEVALKFARSATRRPRIVSCVQGYHGLTYGALSVCGEDYFKKGFEPLVPGCVQVPFGDLDALERELKQKDVAAFITEPIQGRSVAIPEDGYLPAVQQLCRKYGTLFIMDEIQTGLCRTGKMFALEHWGLEPDFVLVAKALSGGYIPVGAMITRRAIYGKVLNSLDRSYVHHSTYGRNRLAMAAGLATLEVMDEQGILSNVNRVGDHLLAGMQAMADKYEMLKQVRGKGLMLGLEFGPPKSMWMKMNWKLIHAASEGLFPQLVVIPLMRDHRIISMVSGHNDVIKFLPPLTMSMAEADEFLQALDIVLDDCHRSKSGNWRMVLDLAKKTASHTFFSRKGS